MTQTERSALTSAALDYDTTIIGALELSEKKWVLAVQLPGVKRHTRHVLGASGEELATLIERLKARCGATGHPIARVILTHEASREGFWLARFLMRRGVEVHVMQPSNLPVDRRARRAKTDVIDVEMLLRTLMAWLRDEPRVCSMVPIPDEADEEARRAHREREDLVRQRRSILNKIDAILATLGVKGYRGLRSDRREQLAGLRQPDDDPVPQVARVRIERLLDRLRQIKEVEVARDAVLKKPAPADEAERMIRSLVDMRAIGPELATLLVREAFSRPIPIVGRSDPMLDSSGRHFPAAEASANKGSARTGTDVCERRWWNSPGCGCAGNPTAPCRLGSGGGSEKPVAGSRRS